MRKVSIIIPTFNEADNVGNLVNQIDYALKGIDYEVIFVDDSNDNTPEKIKEIIKENNRVRLKHRREKKGLATAVLQGFQMAEGDYLAVMDADLQHPPSILKPMYLALEKGNDFCIPSRFIPGGSDGGLGPYRKLVSGVARYIGKILLPCLRKISDPTSGLFMFRKSVIQGKCQLLPIGWKIMVEVLAMGEYKKVVEIPYRFQARPAGESKLTLKVTREYIEQVIHLRKRSKKHKDVQIKRWSQKKVKALEELWNQKNK